jgi:ketosteroid isomerase-like protein
MYHWFVARKTKGILERLGQSEAAFIAASTNDVEFTYPGSHALAGTSRGKDEVRAWFKRYFRCFPALRWDVKDVVVNGTPWGLTVVSAQWSVHGTLENGYLFENEGLHMIRVKRGKLVSVRVYLDTQKSAAALRSLAESGVNEAQAGPAGTTAAAG